MAIKRYFSKRRFDRRYQTDEVLLNVLVWNVVEKDR